MWAFYQLQEQWIPPQIVQEQTGSLIPWSNRMVRVFLNRWKPCLWLWRSPPLHSSGRKPAFFTSAKSSSNFTDSSNTHFNIILPFKLEYLKFCFYFQVFRSKSSFVIYPCALHVLSKALCHPPSIILDAQYLLWRVRVVRDWKDGFWILLSNLLDL
jgi:hypothetical protein